MKINTQIKDVKLFDLIGVTPMAGAICLYSAPLKFSKTPPHRAFFGVGIWKSVHMCILFRYT